MKNTNHLTFPLMLLGVLGVQLGLYELLKSAIDPVTSGGMVCLGALLAYKGGQTYVNERKREEQAEEQ